MWLSADPALGEYIPAAPVSDEARKHNENLPGMGGVYNYVNFNLYHYAGNNPICYTDPDGRMEKIPVPLTGKTGTLAHNTAYDYVDAAIYVNTGNWPLHNKGMFTADGAQKINRKRQDWQDPAGQTLYVWEMKPCHDYQQAQADICF